MCVGCWMPHSPALLVTVGVRVGNRTQVGNGEITLEFNSDKC